MLEIIIWSIYLGISWANSKWTNWISAQISGWESTQKGSDGMAFTLPWYCGKLQGFVWTRDNSCYFLAVLLGFLFFPEKFRILSWSDSTSLCNWDFLHYPLSYLCILYALFTHFPTDNWLYLIVMLRLFDDIKKHFKAVRARIRFLHKDVYLEHSEELI